MSDAFFGFGSLPAGMDGKIVADEVGLEFGIYGPFRLRCVIQPVFSHDSGRLTPVAADARVVPYLKGQPETMPEFLTEVAEADRLVIARICGLLPLANVHNLGVDDIAMLFRHEPAAGEAGMQDVAFMVRRLAGEGVEPSRLICGVEGSDEELVSALRALGLRIALGGAGQPDQDAVRRTGANLVRLDRASFQRFSADAVTGRLLRPVVSELKAHGASVLVEGIDSEAGLELALAAGVDLLSGDLLEPSMLVGSVFDEGPREASQYRRGDCIVIPLFG